MISKIFIQPKRGIDAGKPTADNDHARWFGIGPALIKPHLKKWRHRQSNHGHGGGQA